MVMDISVSYLSSSFLLPTVRSMSFAKSSAVMSVFPASAFWPGIPFMRYRYISLTSAFLSASVAPSFPSVQYLPAISSSSSRSLPLLP